MSTRYNLFNAHLSEAEHKKIAAAHRSGAKVTIEIGPPYEGEVPLHLTKPQLHKIANAYKRQNSAKITLSSAQVKYNVKHGTGPAWDWLKEHVFDPVGKFFKNDIAKPVAHFFGKDVARPFLKGVSGNGVQALPGKTTAIPIKKNKGGAYEVRKIAMTPIQKKKLAAAFRARTPLTLTVGKGQMHGDVPLKLTKTQINRLAKAEKKGAGTRITLSGKQIEHMKKDGGFLEFLLPILGDLLGGVASSALTGVATNLAGSALNSVLGAFSSGKKKSSPQAAAHGGAVGPSPLQDYGAVVGKGADPEGFRPSGYIGNYNDGWLQQERMLPMRQGILPTAMTRPTHGALSSALGRSDFSKRGDSTPVRAGAGSKKKVAVRKYNWGGALMKPLGSGIY